MSNRLALHNKLKLLLGSDEVYFQAPSNIQMHYPCIIYQKTNEKPIYANNFPYKIEDQYSVKVIDKNPDSEIPSLIAHLPKSSFDRKYVADGLNHFVYNLYY